VLCITTTVSYEDYLKSGDIDGVDVNYTGMPERLPWCNFCSPGQAPDTQTYLTYNLLTTGISLPLIGMFGIIGNCVSAFVYSRPIMRSSTNCYLCALALADILVIITGIFLFTAEGMRRHSATLHYYYALGAPVIYWVGMSAQMASVYNTMAAAFDTFVVVVLPVRFR
jgi:hypothetical protein